MERMEKRMKKRVVAYILAAVMLLGMGVMPVTAEPAEAGQTTEEAAGNLISGGSFENGIPAFDGTDGWYSRPSATLREWENTETSNSSVGSLHVQMTLGSGSWAGQSAYAHTVPLRYNSWYKYSYKIKAGEYAVTTRAYYFAGAGDTETVSSASGAIYNDGAVNVLEVGTEDGWVSYEGYIQVKNPRWTGAEEVETTTEVTIYPAFYRGSAGYPMDFYVDDIKLEKVEGSLNSEFALGSRGWESAGTVEEVEGAPNSSGKAARVTAQQSLKQRIAVEPDVIYTVSAWVMIPEEASPAAVTLEARDDSVRSYDTSTGNMAALTTAGNNGSYIPNDGKWYRLTSVLIPGKSNVTHSCYDTDIAVKWTTDPSKSASAGTIANAGDCMYVAEYEVKPTESVWDVIDSSGNVRSSAGLYYTMNKASNRYAAGSAISGWPGSIGMKVVTDTYKWDDGVTERQRMDVAKGTGFQFTVPAGSDADGYFMDRGIDKNKTYDIEVYVRQESGADGDEKVQIGYMPYGKAEERVLSEAVSLSGDWQKLSMQNVAFGEADRLGLYLSGKVSGDGIRFRDFKVVETEEAKTAEVGSVELTETEGMLQTNVSVTGDPLYALRYKYYKRAEGESDYTFISGGETVYGGTVPSITAEPDTSYQVEVAAISSTGMVSAIKSATYSTVVKEFEVGAIQPINAADGSPVDSIAGINQLNAQVEVTNSGEARPMVLIAVAYSENEMQAVEMKETTITESTTVTLDNALPVSEETTSVKFMLWDSLSAMQPYIDAKILDRTSSGMSNTMARLTAGQDVTVAFLGGSITAGTGTTSGGTRYADGVFNWFRAKAEENGATAVNKNYGIGGTGSDYGALRLGEKLAADQPDILFVEFAVNDENKDENTLTPFMESIVRQAKTSNPSMDIVFINSFMGNFLDEYHNGLLPNSVRLNNEIAAYYAIPSINVGKYTYDAIAEAAPNIDKQPNKNDDVGTPEHTAYYTYMSDNSHPNNTGHAFYAEKITEYLEGLYTAEAKAKPAMPVTGLSDYFEGTYSTLTDALASSAVENNGWEMMDGQTAPSYKWDIYKSDAAGESLTFTFNGTGLYLFIPRHNTTGILTVQVDEGAAFEVDTWNYGGSYTIQETYLTDYAIKLIPVVQDLSPGEHTVVITNKGEQSPENTSSAGEKTSAYISAYAVKTN